MHVQILFPLKLFWLCGIFLVVFFVSFFGGGFVFFLKVAACSSSFSCFVLVKLLLHRSHSWFTQAHVSVKSHWENMEWGHLLQEF